VGSLREYVKKRRFDRTAEPKGAVARRRAEPERLFVIQKHRATALHYDFRLESKGVLVSWAVPKGPSLDPATKRLAMHVEDHPMDYARYEGIIPAGEYGGGTVMVWDIGTYTGFEGEDVEEGLRKGALKITLRGKKLHGAWRLVRTGDRQWLLIKSRDEHASKDDITTTKPRSVLTRRLMATIARDAGGDVETARTADPKEP
jgi:bifunctional non-homologous end joining protein LigD